MAKKYKIERNLVLNDIKEGGPEDNVLVIDANNEVGSVARSEFGGGGGSQDLQSVLDNGTSAEYNEGNQFIRIFDPSETITAVEIGSITEDKSSILFFDESGFFLSNVNQPTGREAGMNTQGAVIKLIQSNQLTAASTALSFEDPIDSGAEIKIPAKTTGTYTLATLDDIPTGLTQNITIGANTFTFTNGVLTDFKVIDPGGDLG